MTAGSAVNGRHVVGFLTAAASVALATVGATLSVPAGSVDIPNNRLETGVLALDVSLGQGVDAPLEFSGLVPGDTSVQRVWVVRNERTSPVPATVTLTIGHLTDVAAPCDTARDKALAEIAAGIGGCTVKGNDVSGIPHQGNASRLLSFAITSSDVEDGPVACEGDRGQRSLLASSAPGNLRSLALAHGGAGTRLRLGTSARKDLVLRPGQGVCISVIARWRSSGQRTPTPSRPGDNAAQGDTMRVRARFDLVQVHS